MYIQPSFLNSCEEHGLWSGGNDQYRGDRSVDFSTFTKSGRARVEAFSDEALEANKEKRKTSVPLRDRILPQYRRVQTLTDQLIELEREYKSGSMSISEYSTLRAVVVTKRNKAQELYKKAVSVTEPVHEEDYSYDETSEDSVEIYANSLSNPSDNNGHRESYSSPVGGSFFAQAIDELSNDNSFKNILQKGCVACRTLVRWHQATRNYIKTLSEV